MHFALLSRLLQNLLGEKGTPPGRRALCMQSLNCTVASRFKSAVKGTSSSDTEILFQNLHTGGNGPGSLPLASPSLVALLISALGCANLAYCYEMGHERDHFPKIS